MSLDDALTEFHHYAHEYAGGMSSHGPMVVESLEHAGLGDHIDAWTADYVTRLDPVGVATVAPEGGLQLGDARAEAWTQRFCGELAERPWREVVSAWAPTLLPGSAGAAGHGVLRAAHAVRGLGRADTPARVAELAHGLGYWAATAHRLPGEPATGTATPSDALAAVPSTSSDAWFISERVAAVDGATFGPAVAAAALPTDPDDALTAVVDLALRVLVTNPTGAIAFIHSVTVPACLRHLLPFLDDEGRLAVANQAWWVLAGLWSAYGSHASLDTEPPDSPSWDDLVASALARGDEHDIKLTVAARDQVGRVDDRLLRAAVAGVLSA